MKRTITFLACLGVLAGCGPDAEEITEVTFPAGFLWGGATAGFQIESGLDHTDWGKWADMEGKIEGGDDPNDGPDALAHIDGDVGLMAEAGLNAYRFGLEMARVYPTRDHFDLDKGPPAELARYDELVDKLVAAKIVPMATLHHFVWPVYMSDPASPDKPQGWERDDAVEVFASYCRRMAAHFGDRVDLWITINEPTVEASVGYLATVFPPGVSDVNRVVAVMKKQLEAHARCYDAIHEADTVDADGDGRAAMVSIAKHNRVYEAADPGSADDVAAVAHSRRFWNSWFMDAIVHGDVDEDFDDVVDVKGDAALRGRADFLGVNYYGASRIDSRALTLPYLGVQPAQFNLPTGRPKNDLGWDIHAAGFGQVLDEAAAYGLPLYITENGIADAKDVNRSRFLAEHVFEIGKAMARGAKVRGYFHWSLVDNFEWAGGFCPRFGLYTVDYDAADKARSPTAAVAWLKGIASSRRLAKAEIAKLPPYQSAPSPCAGF